MRTTGELIPLIAGSRIEDIAEMFQTFSDDELIQLSKFWGGNINNTPDNRIISPIKEELLRRSQIRREDKLNDMGI